MIVCPTKKLCFIHVYKTGGTSLTSVLAPYTVPELRHGDPVPLGNPGWQEQWHVGGQQHSSYEENADLLGDLIGDDWRFLVVCRNPVTWIASIYYEVYHCALPCRENELFGQFNPLKRLEDFIGFVRAFKHVHPNFWGFRAQKSFVRGIPEEKLSVIRFEDFSREAPGAMKSLGFDFDAVPHHLDRGGEKAGFLGDLCQDPAFRRFVCEMFAEDFDFYGYAREHNEIAPAHFNAAS